jgi:hypothetical protein
LTRVCFRLSAFELPTNVYQALAGAESKLGGGKVDPAKMRSTNEKITDTGREQFEAATG